MRLSRREQILAAVLVLVLGFGGGSLFLRSEDDGIGSGRSGGGRAVDGAAELRIARLRLADLDPEPSQLEIGRDLFRFVPAPAPPRPERPAPELRPERRPPPEPTGPRPPRLDLSYLGSFGPEGRTIAVFSDGETIINAIQGEVLDGKFIVERIGFESVDMKFVGFPGVPAKRLAAGR